jgi:transposase-like protein
MADVNRAEILAAAKHEGCAQAARRLGVNPSTLRSWRRRANGAPERAAGVPEDPLVAAELRAREAWRVASEALAAASRAISASKPVNARNYAVTVGVLCDKAQQIEVGLERLQDRALRLDEAHAHLVFAVLERFCCGRPRAPIPRALGRT